MPAQMPMKTPSRSRRMYTGRNKVVLAATASYHGSSFGAGNLTGEPRRYPLEPGIPGFVKFFDPYIYRENRWSSRARKRQADYYLAKLREQVIYEGRGPRRRHCRGDHHRL